MIGIASADDQFKREAMLTEIGLPESVYLTALDKGDAAARNCGPDHPPIAAGFYRFSEIIVGLAVGSRPFGWTRRDYKNFSTIVSPEGSIAVAVASGDEGTGDLAEEVSTRSRKGVATEEAVDLNFKLPYDERYVAENARIVSPEPPKKTPSVTYFLLHDRRDGIRYAELSRPMTIEDGRIKTWEPRIPLRPQALDPIVIDSGGEPPVSPEVAVRRRD